MTILEIICTKCVSKLKERKHSEDIVKTINNNGLPCSCMAEIHIHLCSVRNPLHCILPGRHKSTHLVHPHISLFDYTDQTHTR